MEPIRIIERLHSELLHEHRVVRFDHVFKKETLHLATREDWCFTTALSSDLDSLLILNLPRFQFCPGRSSARFQFCLGDLPAHIS